MEGRVKPVVHARWENAVLVCRKCSKRARGGFGPKGKLSLAKALKRIGGGKGRKARFGVVEVKCLSVCPRDGVTVVAANDLVHWHVVRPGTPVEEVAEALGVGFYR